MSDTDERHTYTSSLNNTSASSTRARFMQRSMRSSATFVACDKYKYEFGPNKDIIQSVSFEGEDINERCPPRHPLIVAFQSTLSSSLSSKKNRTSQSGGIVYEYLVQTLRGSHL
eukprot:296866_1